MSSGTAQEKLRQFSNSLALQTGTGTDAADVPVCPTLPLSEEARRAPVDSSSPLVLPAAGTQQAETSLDVVREHLPSWCFTQLGQ